MAEILKKCQYCGCTHQGKYRCRVRKLHAVIDNLRLNEDIEIKPVPPKKIGTAGIRTKFIPDIVPTELC